MPCNIASCNAHIKGLIYEDGSGADVKTTDHPACKGCPPRWVKNYPGEGALFVSKNNFKDVGDSTYIFRDGATEDSKERGYKFIALSDKDVQNNTFSLGVRVGMLAGLLGVYFTGRVKKYGTILWATLLVLTLVEIVLLIT